MHDLIGRDIRGARMALLAAVLAAALADTARSASIVQVNFEPHFNADVVVNTSGAGFDPMEDTIEGAWAFSTQAGGIRGGLCDGPWLPDDGFFPATSSHPEAQLGFSDDDDGPNVWQTYDEAGEITVQVPNLAYEAFYLYATGAYETFLTVTLNYTTGSPESYAGLSYPSWFDEAAPPFFNLVDGLDRARFDGSVYTCEDVDDPGIVGLGFPVDSTRVLDSVTLERTDNDAGMLNVFGGTAVLARTVYNYDISSVFNADLIANAPSGCAGIGSYDHVHDGLWDGYHLPTATMGSCFSDGAGIPDDGVFPLTGDHPRFDLAYSNSDNGLNARRSPPGVGDDVYVLDVTDAAVDELHLFGAGGGGYAVIGVELTYATGPPYTIPGGAIIDGTLADGGELGPDTYYLGDGMRGNKSTSGGGGWAYTNDEDAALFGLRIAVDSSRVLTAVEITSYDPTGFPVPQSTLGLFGASGVRLVNSYIYVDDFEANTLTGWSTQFPPP